MKARKRIWIVALTLALAVSSLTLPTMAANNSCDAVITASSLQMRSGAGLGYSILGTAPRGATLTVIGIALEDSGWYKVNYNGVVGYMDSTYVQSASSSAAAEAIVKAAAEAAAGGAAVQQPTVNEQPAAPQPPVVNEPPVATQPPAQNDASDTILYPSGSANATVTGDLVRMRTTPGGEIIGNFTNGARILVTAVSGSWYEVNCNGTVGYVHSSYAALDSDNTTQTAPETPVEQAPAVQPPVEAAPVATPEPTPQPTPEPTPVPAAPAVNYGVGQQVVNMAMQYQGVPYVYGGTSPSGFDCSGLCYYVYQQCGYSINRVAHSIYTGSGVSVTMDQLAVGDIICFGSPSYISHVGIYIGGGQFIHAPHTGAVVRVESLSGSYYNNFVCGKRIA